MAACEQTPGIALAWTPRTEPLTPLAVVAQGNAARQLGRRLLSLDDAGLAGLQGVSGEGVLLVLGEPEALPWVPGVAYLGRDPEAPALLFPTTHTVTLPVALLQRALLARFSQSGVPLAILREARQVVPVQQACSISRELLRDWLGKAD